MYFKLGISSLETEKSGQTCLATDWKCIDLVCYTMDETSGGVETAR